jgi:hypothetical protein
MLEKQSLHTTINDMIDVKKRKKKEKFEKGT